MQALALKRWSSHCPVLELAPATLAAMAARQMSLRSLPAGRLEKPEGAVHRLPPTIVLPGDWPATYRVQPDAFPHLCAKCHQLKAG